MSSGGRRRTEPLAVPPAFVLCPHTGTLPSCSQGAELKGCWGKVMGSWKEKERKDSEPTGPAGAWERVWAEPERTP